MKNDVIVSISTPLGRGAISIVRLSGEDSLEIALRIFSFKNKKLDKNFKIYKNSTQNFKNSKKNNIISENFNLIQPRYMYYGTILIDEGEEECLMVYFKAPFSYTGENIVEFHVHGGVMITQKILEKCICCGARLAEAGEYSKRAFLNGKISLDKAEAIIGEINAESEGELRSSLQITSGKLAELVDSMQEEIKLILAELEVGMDYPDETDELRLKTNIFGKLLDIEKNLDDVLEKCESAKFLKIGINVALVGRTNVGKSSIMNSLLGENRAIVTDIKGTTRDVVSESFLYNGIKVNLLDTAGIRNTNDFVETLGIERSKQSVLSCDLVLYVLDGSENQNDEDNEIEKLISNKKHIYVVNKSDKKRILPHKDDEVEVSALTGVGFSNLKNKILEMVKIGEISSNSLIITNERQFQILKDSKNLLKTVLTSKNLTLDVLCMQLHTLWQTLGKITGKTENEDIIDLIFSKFCLGK